MLGVRNGFYGLAMAPLLDARGWRRPAAAQLTIDESTAVGTAQLARVSGDGERLALVRVGFWTTGLSVFALWNLATLAGGLAGSAVGDPRQYGLDAAAAAAFLALLWPRLRERVPQVVGFGAAGLAAVLVPVAPAGIPVLASVLVALAAGYAARGAGALDSAS
jgi:predicted branched-subunit amino acid permease